MKNFKFNWQKIGEVVDFDKNEKHIGCADLLKAQLGNYIVVGGGSNFPNGNVTVGGKRTLNKKIYLFYADNDKIKQVDSIDFDYPFSNGATTTDDNNIYHIIANDKNGSDIVKFSINNNKLSFTIIDSLPFPMENIILEFFEDTLIFGCGKISNELSRTLYRYNLSSKTLETFAYFPGNERGMCLSTIYDNSLIIYGGGASVTYNDGFKCDFANKKWEKLAPLSIKGKSYSLLGADWIRLNDDTMLVTGGFNNKLWKYAVAKLSTLKGDDLERFRKYYFSMPVHEYNWNKEVFVYNIKENTWQIVATLPYAAPCGHALLKIDDNIYSLMGEIKPAVRTPNIYHSKINFKDE